MLFAVPQIRVKLWTISHLCARDNWHLFFITVLFPLRTSLDSFALSVMSIYSYARKHHIFIRLVNERIILHLRTTIYLLDSRLNIQEFERDMTWCGIRVSEPFFIILYTVLVQPSLMSTKGFSNLAEWSQKVKMRCKSQERELTHLQHTDS